MRKDRGEVFTAELPPAVSNEISFPEQRVQLTELFLPIEPKVSDDDNDLAYHGYPKWP